MTDKDGQEPEHGQGLIEGKTEELRADEKPSGNDDRTAAEASRAAGKRKAFRVIADLDVVDIGTVTLDQIVATRYKLQAQSADISDDAYQRLTESLHKLQLDYGDYGRGYVLDNYFCRYIPAGVALKIVGRRGLYARIASAMTFQGRYLDQIDLSYLPEAARTTDPTLEAAIWDCKRIYLQGLRCRARRRSYLVRSIYSVFVYLLSLADSEAMSGYDAQRTERALPKVQEQLRYIEDMLEESNTMEARHDYLLGMLMGVFGLWGAFWLAFEGFGILRNLPDGLLVGVAISGGVGAIMSVMTRLTSGKLSVDSRAGPMLIRLAGGFRPVIGAIFGLALYIFIAASLLPVAVTVQGLKLTYFFIGVAFIAGFSERLAQDAITRASSAIPATEVPEGPAPKPPPRPGKPAKT